MLLETAITSYRSCLIHWKNQSITCNDSHVFEMVYSVYCSCIDKKTVVPYCAATNILRRYAYLYLMALDTNWQRWFCKWSPEKPDAHRVGNQSITIAIHRIYYFKCMLIICLDNPQKKTHGIPTKGTNFLTTNITCSRIIYGSHRNNDHADDACWWYKCHLHFIESSFLS